MQIEKDFEELAELFNKHKVDFIIVGGYALAFHGAPRYTGDIDFFVKPDLNNAEKIMNALIDFGFGSLDFEMKDFSVPGKIVQLGVPPVRIDIITSLSGVSWKDAYESRVNGKYGKTKVYFIGKKQFLKNKKTTSRPKDLADIDALKERGQRE